MPAEAHLVTAVILAGGNATRMNGANKGLVKLYNTPLIQYVIHKIAPQVDELLINANRDITEFEAFGYPVIRDNIKHNGDLIGPLAGFHAGLTTALYEYVLFVPCDMPNLPSNLCECLITQLQLNSAEIAVLKTGNDVIPVVCVCKKTVLPSLIAYINQGNRKVSTWQKSCVYVEVNLPNTFSYNNNGEMIDQGGNFTNLNSAQDILDYE